ncbi:MAG TPA: glycosyltransferase family 39 protein [Coriobacteriia bacterium]
MHRSDRTFVSILAGLCLLAAVLGVVLANGHPKLTYDSAFYLSAGENLAAGHGLTVDITNVANPLPYEPFKRWPPLYPILIGVLAVLRVPSMFAATLVSAVAFAATLAFVGLLGRQYAGRTGGVVSAALALLFVPYWIMASSALSDMLFTALAAGSVYFVSRLLADEDRPRRLLLAATGLAAAAAFTRHIGVVMALFGAVVFTAEALRRRSLRDLWRGVGYGLGTVLPLGVWTAFDPLTWGLGALRTAPGKASFLRNLWFVKLTASRDFGVYVLHPALSVDTLAAVVRGAALLAVLAVVAVGVVRWWRRGPGDFPGSALVPAAYALVYMVVIAALRSRANFAWLDSRLVSPAYPGMLAVIGAAAVLIGKRLAARIPRYPVAGAVAAACIVLVIPIWGSVPSVVAQQRAGAGFDEPFWRYEPGIRAISERRPDSVITNVTAPVYLQTHVPVKAMTSGTATFTLGILEECSHLREDRFLVHIFNPDDPRTSNEFDVPGLIASPSFRVLMHTPGALLLEPVAWPPARAAGVTLRSTIR